MTRFVKELNTYLFIFRWTLLAIGFVTYSKIDSPEYGWLIFILIANFVYTVTIFSAINKRIQLSLVILDLILGFSFLLFTGQGMSPFVLYSLSTLIWLKTLTGNRISLIVMFCYYAAVSFTFYLSFQFEEVAFWLNQLEFTVYFFFFLWFILFMNYGSTFIKENYRILYLLFQVNKRLIHESNFSNIQSSLEDAILKIYKTESAFICWMHPKGTPKEWEKHYIQRIYLEKQLFLLNKPQWLSLPSYTGEELNYFYFPFKDGRNSIGGFLLPFEHRNHIRRYQYTYLHLISSILLEQMAKMEMKQEMAVSLKEAVRKKMAQDMHDGLAQQLFFLSAQMFHLKNKLKDQSNPDLMQVINNMEAQLKASHLEVRNFIRDLRDDQAAETNLSDAIQQLINRTKTETSIQVSFETNGALAFETVEQEKAIYRMIEEAVHNVKKHAKASKLLVSIEGTSVQWTIRIADNGIGFKPADTAAHSTGSFGLKGIQERAEQLGGQFYLKTAPFKGTEIAVVIPKERGIFYA